MGFLFITGVFFAGEENVFVKIRFLYLPGDSQKVLYMPKNEYEKENFILNSLSPQDLRLISKNQIPYGAQIIRVKGMILLNKNYVYEKSGVDCLSHTYKKYLLGSIIAPAVLYCAYYASNLL